MQGVFRLPLNAKDKPTMPYKPSKEAIVIAVVYLCLMLWTTANTLLDPHSGANKTLAALLMTVAGLGVLLFMDSELPP